VARPKEFERDVVLDRAMQVFWSRGYEAASIQLLVDRMGIQRGSLYDTFGDKRGLFFAAIARYDRVVTAKLLAALEEPASGKDAIRRFFRLKVELSVEPGRPRGCLVTNSAAQLASRDRGTATKVGAVLGRIEAAFHRAVVRGQEAGEIDPRRSARALARFLTSSAQGLSVMAKTFPDRAVLDDIVKVTLTALDSPHRPLDHRRGALTKRLRPQGPPPALPQNGLRRPSRRPRAKDSDTPPGSVR
jgi:TetR/AcrR family transcriptional repressor of nem operon